MITLSGAMAACGLATRPALPVETPPPYDQLDQESQAEIDVCATWHPGDQAQMADDAPDKDMRGKLYMVRSVHVMHVTDKGSDSWVCRLLLNGQPVGKDLFHQYWLRKPA